MIKIKENKEKKKNMSYYVSRFIKKDSAFGVNFDKLFSLFLFGIEFWVCKIFIKYFPQYKII